MSPWRPWLRGRRRHQGAPVRGLVRAGVDPHDGPQAGALGPGVGGDLRRRRLPGTPEDELVPDHGAADARQAGRAHAPARGGLGEGLLRQPVLARVVADHRAHATDRQVRQGDGQRGRELAQLVVHRDAERLEHPAGRVALPAGRRRHGRRHDFGQLPRGGQWPGSHDGPGDAPGQPPLSVLTEQRRQGLHGEAVHQVGGGRARGRVHPHVERPVLAEREAPLGPVELRGADAEIEQHARQGPEPGTGDDRLQRRERGGNERDPVPERRTSRARAASRAAGSRSSPTMRSAGYASSSAAAWPPPPTVASTTTPGGTDANSETTSSRSTGMCSNEWAICSPSAGGSRGRWRSERPTWKWVEWPSSAPVEELHMVQCVPRVLVVVFSVLSCVLSVVCPVRLCRRRASVARRR